MDKMDKLLEKILLEMLDRQIEIVSVNFCDNQDRIIKKAIIDIKNLFNYKSSPKIPMDICNCQHKIYFCSVCGGKIKKKFEF